jgi:protein-tyrosine phosphatase
MKILLVDAGNYCRSPAAQAVCTKLARAASVQVAFSSAGLKDKHVGDTADPRTIAACAERGYSLDGFRCREISPADFGASDLILAMDRDNLSQLEQRRPPGNRVRIELFLGDREVPDPYYGETDGFAQMMDRIEGGARRLLATLGLSLPEAGR